MESKHLLIPQNWDSASEPGGRGARACEDLPAAQYFLSFPPLRTPKPSTPFPGFIIALGGQAPCFANLEKKFLAWPLSPCKAWCLLAQSLS